MLIQMSEFIGNLLLALAAGLFALPVAWERERAERPAGIRTFPGVALINYLILRSSKPAARQAGQVRHELEGGSS